MIHDLRWKLWRVSSDRSKFVGNGTTESTSSTPNGKRFLNRNCRIVTGDVKHQWKSLLSFGWRWNLNQDNDSIERIGPSMGTARMSLPSWRSLSINQPATRSRLTWPGLKIELLLFKTQLNRVPDSIWQMVYDADAIENDLKILLKVFIALNSRECAQITDRS